MQKSNDGLLYSASDLGDFLLCKHLINLKRIDLDTPLQKDEADEQTKLLQDKGFEHEASYLETLRAQGKSIASIDVKNLKRTEQVEASIEAMYQGDDVIYQAALLQLPFYGISDFLFKVPVPSKLGSWSYEVADTKLSTHPKARHLMQVGLYSSMLAEVQGIMPSMTHLVMGNHATESFRLADYLHYVNHAKQRFLNYAPQKQASYPEKCSHCDLCQFRTLCDTQWEADDHLNRVANIRKNDIKRLKASGITTLTQLAELGDPATNPIAKLGTQETLWRQAWLQLKKRLEGEDIVQLKDLQEEKRLGFHRLPKPNEGDLYFDMEGNPMEEGGLEYLFGVSYLDGGGLVFKPFWAHTRQEEKKAFEDFIDFVSGRIALYPDLHIYHYADYERRALQSLMGLHGTREAQVDNLLRSQKLVDLFAVVRHAILTSEPRYSIKNLETFYMKGERSADVKNAGASIIYYEAWKKTQDPNTLEQIRQYNEEDCRSTKLLHDWLLDLRAKDMPWYDPNFEQVEEVDLEKKAKIAEIEAARERYRLALVQPLPEDFALRTKENNVRQLLFDLLDFYRREDKPTFWKMYDRKEKDLEDLLEDLDCLAGLTLDITHPVVSEARSFIVTYRYPEQDHRILVDDACQDAETLMNIGKVVSFSQDAYLVKIKVGPSAMKEWNGNPPTSLSIAASKYVDKKVLQAALVRYVDSQIARQPNYQALTAFLHRDFPAITGKSQGKPIVEDGQEAGDAAIKLIHALDNSYLFIQGPPGAGKTYTGSQAIVSLLKAGKRVAVSANSHKAIVNLLNAVEEVAIEQNFTFRGVKKGSDGPDGMAGSIIQNNNTEDVYDGAYQLVGGTAWALANEMADQAFDYLFVDEAGQVSLASLIVIGVCAKNIILLGDHMQLGQPLQGTHPNESGKSALEYLLGGLATIPPERGVFLGVTWRMHPDVCRFISDAVYESKLFAQQKNSIQKLVLNANSHKALKPTGITFFEANHDECAQISREEAQIIKDIVTNLMQQEYQNNKGETHPITAHNILVVAPYNAQVKTIKSYLPAGIEVGTVDKFQGLEAEVVIVSMTTSNSEYLPRNMEFLYNKNRLNVAVSRARSLAIVIANPKLLETDCTSPAQMGLVNTLCWLREYTNG
jgi:uncharacterized protein